MRKLPGDPTRPLRKAEISASLTGSERQTRDNIQALKSNLSAKIALKRLTALRDEISAEEVELDMECYPLSKLEAKRLSGHLSSVNVKLDALNLISTGLSDKWVLRTLATKQFSKIQGMFSYVHGQD